MTTSPLRRRWLFAVGVLLLILLAFGVRALTSPARAADQAAAKKPPPAVQVTLATVLLRDVPLYRAGIGTATANASVVVKARIDGQLDRVGFVEGQDVKAGQMLAQIDPRTLQAQLAQAEAQRARDEAQLANARVDLQRYAALIAEDAATQQQVDTQKALVAQLEATVRTDTAQVNYAKVQLGFTTIVAPMSGRVGARLVDPGNIVHAADTGGLVVINQIDPISVVFTLPEEVVQDIHRAQQASHQPLQVDAFARGGEKLGTGRLILVNNQIDTTNGTVQLKGSFVNPAHALWPGQYVNVRLVLGQRAQALTVPAAVVQRSQDGTYAYVVADDDTVRMQPIKVAQIQDGIAIVDAGLSAGQRVVLDGQYKLKPGSTIAEAKAATKRPAQGASAAEAEAAAGPASSSSGVAS